ncbi:hypothetical protein M752DRAFT_278883 [Aspergillus phoenicis ATCC 13157]|uniref:Uncharacterized protein n=1 Tax=Aspergillus phoenicis ATCC 13157 TaxID=1353007 RepID=A0A370P8Z5_ASPPH|nr:hypothetical protein M752DRAFT_278883 [Aspergillus phoenicis ATCC 13157]
MPAPWPGRPPGLHSASSLFHVSCFSKVDSRHLEHASPGHQPSFPPDELHPNKLVPDDRMLCLAVGLHKWR